MAGRQMTLERAVAIDIDGDLVESIYRRVAAVPGELWENNNVFGGATALERTRCTIFRLPAYIREKKEHNFEPQVVSIGPIHRGKDHLHPMQQHKWRYLHDLLSRSDSSNGLEAFVKEMKELEWLIRGCYAETLGLSSDEFVKMLLLDGSFILEFVLKGAFNEVDTMVDLSGFLKAQVYNDLLMFENQIPFLVLECLFEHLPPRDVTSPFVRFVCSTIFADKHMNPPSFGVNHFLHLHYHFTAPVLKSSSTANDQSPCERPTQAKTILCAEELLEAGVKFEKKTSDDDLDITFKNGVLRIPPLTIDKSTKSRYFNFVVFEQSIGIEDQFTSYALFMDCIINTRRDVAILQQCGIVENMLPSDEEAALFFNRLAHECGYINFDKHSLAGLFGDVNDYCRSKCNRYMAKFKRDHCSNPWVTISLLASVTVFILAVKPVFFAVYSFFFPPSPGPSIM